MCLYLRIHLGLYVRSSLSVLFIDWLKESLRKRNRSTSINKHLWSDVVIMSNSTITQYRMNGTIPLVHNIQYIIWLSLLYVFGALYVQFYWRWGHSFQYILRVMIFPVFLKRKIHLRQSVEWLDDLLGVWCWLFCTFSDSLPFFRRFHYYIETFDIPLSLVGLQGL